MFITVTFGPLEFTPVRGGNSFVIDVQGGANKATLAKTYKKNREKFGFQPDDVAATPGDATISVEFLRTLARAGMNVDAVFLRRKDHAGRYEKFFFEQDANQTDILGVNDIERIFSADPAGRVGLSAAGYVAVLMFLMGDGPRWFDWMFAQPYADFTEFAEERPIGGAFV